MDLKVIEEGNGGELVKTAKDLVVISGLQNMVYLALFGGCVEASTPTKRLPTEQAADWWGNSLLFPDNPERQLNSLTERTLNEVALTSSGRVRIEQAVLKDLDFMKAFAEVSASVSIPETDKVVIQVTVQEPDNIEEQAFTFIWDATKNELVEE
jgi:phage gp46-like protein